MCLWSLYSLMLQQSLAAGKDGPRCRTMSRELEDGLHRRETLCDTKRRRLSRRKQGSKNSSFNEAPAPVVLVPRPPKWEVTAVKRNPHRASLEQFKERQLTYLERFRADAAAGRWAAIHRAHFDWWMFPIDDGSQIQYNILGEGDVQELKADPEWHERYLESVRIVAEGWAWDVDRMQRLPTDGEGKGWTKWTGSDVRLAKMIRSLWLFEEERYMASLQAFAQELKANEKEGKPFVYGHTVLDEILFMALPRRAV
eukprot:EG_transcript_13475